MIQILPGEKGTGKTKKIIAMANKVSESIKGSTVFLDDDSSYMYDLGYSIRFVNITEYDVHTPAGFLGFIAGLCASDYDLEAVFVDRFLEMMKLPLEELESFFEKLEVFCNLHKLTIVFSVGQTLQQLPAYMQTYQII